MTTNFDHLRLASVPNQFHELTIKATHTGIVLLNAGRFKKRYTGSKTSIVDINGKLYCRAKDMPVEIVDSKKIPRKTPIMRGKDNVSNEEESKSNEKKDMNIEKKQCAYRVNKVEVRNRLNAMIETKRGKKELYFWTVTFPPVMTDQLCYRALNTWLTNLRQKKMLRNYLWVAERQTGQRKKDSDQATNTIHYHLAIPHKMSVVAANRFMREILADYCKKRLIEYSVYQCKRYNGVDIAKNRNTKRVTNFAIKKGGKSLSVYMAKYVAKNDGVFQHLAWHNSRGFSALFTGITFTVSEFVNAGHHFLLNRKAILKNEFFMFFAWLKDPPFKIVDHLARLNSFVADELFLLS